MNQYDFDPIRPYYEEEIPAALKRIVANPQFDQLMRYLFPEEQHSALKSKIIQSKTRLDFQLDFMFPVIQSILDKTADDISYTGIDKLSKDKGYVFIANHRDIILDSYILCLLLAMHDHEPCKITWGDNLMVSPFVVDIGKVNRMITVFREGSPKEIFKNSQLLSAYIRQSVTEDNHTVWIAQRKGRSKDGNDITDVSVLKMLSLTGGRDIVNSLKNLNIIPVTISYEWEPCDSMKVRELLMSEENEYIKGENEDLQSIIGGVVSQKGRIHMNVGVPINDKLDSLDTSKRPNEIIQGIASIIDKQMYTNYKLWPVNYLAYDLLEGSKKYAEKYDKDIESGLNDRLNLALETIDRDHTRIRELFLKMYANPVYNQLNPPS